MEQADKGKININSKGPFDNPTKPVTVNGSTFVPLDAFNEEYNTSFSSIEYQELWLIHSLAHITMAKEFKDEQSYGDIQTNNEKIISNCFENKGGHMRSLYRINVSGRFDCASFSLRMFKSV